jgi:hypothetical protein
MQRLLLPFLLLLVSAPLPVFGQFLLRVTQGNQIAAVNNGSSVTVSALGIGQPSILTYSIAYAGTGTGVTFRGAPELLGSTDFTFVDPPPSNATLGPGQALTIRIAYTPSSAAPSNAEFNWNFTEQLTADTSRQGLLILGINGVTPDFKVAYVFAIDGNVTQLPDQGASISFIQTPLNNTTTATIAVVNRGSGTGELQSVLVSGDAFSLVSVPLLPTAIAAGGSTTFQLRYRPRQIGTDTGTLTLTFAGGATRTIQLVGNGISSYFTYELLPPTGPAQSISPNQVVVLPATQVGQRTTSFVRFRNDTQFDITASAIAVTGEGFSLEDLPFLPLTVAPGQSYVFSLTFAPTRAGRLTGRLRVGNDTFDLAADAIGSILKYSYTSPGGTINVQPLEGVVLPTVPPGETSTIDFTVRNDGTAAAPLTSIGVTSNVPGAFSVANLPPLPSSIAPGASVTFQVRYKAITSGPVTATLLVNGVSFPLLAISTDPGTLPDYTITGPTTVQAFDQPRVGLTLARPYGVTLRGTLNLVSESDTAFADPAVQFSSGGRTASFTIPAGSTQAVFFNGATDIRFQAGSAAGSFYITPTFSTEGGTDLTPSIPKTLRITLPPAPPRLLVTTVSSMTATTLVVNVTGVSVTRSITRVRVSFKGKPGYNFPTTEFTQDTSGQSLLWFQSITSSNFGGQFTAALPFVFSSSDSGSGATAPTQTIESVTVIFENAQGASNSITVPIS